ncbi:MAG: D-sedoheptulose 7-phosphate isomerase [Proteobacteria bacterium]|nr:D-sedoheptulose 7-phosphate isomerase [Pseudomonadota bacterium]
MAAESPLAGEIDEHLSVARATLAAVQEPFDRLLALSVEAIRGGHKLLFFGNGGSAADAQHLATELTVRFERERAPIAALALTTDSSALTAIGNDLGFDSLFARQIEALGNPGDVAIGITTSGRSRNVIRGLEAARAGGLVAAAFAGRDGGDLPGIADPLVIVPSNVTSRIQEMHITLGHALCLGLERALGMA